MRIILYLLAVIFALNNAWAVDVEQIGQSHLNVISEINRNIFYKSEELNAVVENFTSCSDITGELFPEELMDISDNDHIKFDRIQTRIPISKEMYEKNDAINIVFLQSSNHLNYSCISNVKVFLDDAIQENRISCSGKRRNPIWNTLTGNLTQYLYSDRFNEWNPSVFIQNESKGNSNKWIWNQSVPNQPEMNSIIIDFTEHYMEDFDISLRVAWPPKQRRSLSLIALVFSPPIFSKLDITTSIAVSYR